jgi:putative transposase
MVAIRDAKECGESEGVKKPKPTGHNCFKGDQRILGDSRYVTDALLESEEDLSRRYRLRGRRCSFEKVAERVSALLDLEKDYITGRGRQRDRVRARGLLCYWCVVEPGIPMADLSIDLDLMLAALSYAAERGKEIAKATGSHLDG